ncbi:MAG: CusA/CzcA family heavy metal efflux RND transporter [Nannocystaceae bacterium]
MIESIVAASLRHRLAVLLVALATLVWGAFSLAELRIEAFPDPTDTQVQVIALHPGQPAEEIERQVSLPIERAINGAPGLTRVRSQNLFGLAFITLTFDDETEVQAARAQTLERLRLAPLPRGVLPQLGSLSTPIGEIYRYTLRAVDPDPLAMRTIQDWVIRPRLLRVEGVADVVSLGGLVREIQVRPDPAAMAAHALTIGELAEAIARASVNASGGVIEQGAEQLVIRSEGLFDSIEDVGQTAVASRGGTPIFLADIASIQEGWAPRQGVVGRGRDLDVVEGVVLMRRGENPSDVLGRTRAAIAELDPRLAAAGVRIDPFYDRGELVDATLRTVGRNLGEGAALVILVLVAFLLDLRAALIVAVIIPLALATAFIYLHQRGMAANLISMGAVDFGIIVDGAVVIVEAVLTRLGDGPGSGETQAFGPAGRIRQAVAEIARPTVFSLLIIIAAYLPIFLLQRVEGRLFAPLAHTVVAALLGSLAFSITLVPVLASIAYRRGVRPHRSPIFAAALAIYGPALRRALRAPLLVLGLAGGSLVIAGGLLATRGSEFMPEINEGALYLTVTLPANASLGEGRTLAPRLAGLVADMPEVEAMLTQLGRPEDGTDPKLASNLEIFVKLRPAETWGPETPSLGALIERMNARFTSIPGIEVNFSQPIRDNVADNIAGQVGQVALKIYGDDLAAIEGAAEAARRALVDVEGIADLGLVKAGVIPQLTIAPRRDRLGRFGLEMADLQGFLATALGGQAVGELWEGERVTAITLRLPEDARGSVERITRLRVPTPRGALIPLGEVAEVMIRDGRAAISREDGQRYIGVRMNVRGRDLGSFVDEAKARVDAAVVLPEGARIAWAGELESKDRATRRLLVVVPAALALTLLFLFYSFGSLGLALLVLANVPFALVGGAIGLWIVDIPLSIAAAVGFIALVGQAALSGVLVVTAIEARRQGGAPLLDAVVDGARDRLRPVLMTAALAALGLVPAALSRAMGAETQRPIAVVIVGGTISAALLTLFVLPVMYALGRRLAGDRS